MRCSGDAANWAINRRVTLGATSESPLAAYLIARSSSVGSASFRRNPVAPARIASNTYSSRSNVVSTTTWTDAREGSATIVRVAASPSTFGIRMSITTTSGSNCRVSSIAAVPSSASPTTSMSSSASSSIRKPALSSTWSSAMTDANHDGFRRRGHGGWTDDGARQRQPGADGEPAAWAGTGDHVPADGGRPFGHAGDAVPAAPVGIDRRRRAPTVVDDLDPHRIGFVADGHRRRRVHARVAHHVGQRLLHDAVRGEVDRRRNGRRSGVAVDGDGDAGVAGVLDQRVDLVEPWRRRQRDLVVVAQHTDGRPQLVERLLAELLDGRERRTGLFRMAIEHVQGGPGLHVDRGDAVGDHVVEVAGDAEALLGDAAPGFLLTGFLQVLRALLELGEVGPPAEVGRAEEHRPADPPGEGEEVHEVLARVLAEQREREQEDDRRDDRHPRPATVAPLGDRVQRHERREIHRSAGEVRCRVHTEPGDHDAERHVRHVAGAATARRRRR